MPNVSVVRDMSQWFSHSSQMTAPLTTYIASQMSLTAFLHTSLTPAECMRQKMASAVLLTQNWAWWQGHLVSNECQCCYSNFTVDLLICLIAVRGLTHWCIQYMLFKTCKKCLSCSILCVAACFDQSAFIPLLLFSLWKLIVSFQIYET